VEIHGIESKTKRSTFCKIQGWFDSGHGGLGVVHREWFTMNGSL